ncbi:MAG TPA: NRDE family protein [Casimicrobiaceae bacterium]|nr:NRDE family protein [Casimicrobiaceae bacterium]
MCLALVALDAHPKYRCVIAANRDEFHARAAEPAHWWDQAVLAGRDLVAGGSWFGVTRAGRWALITNFREGAARDPYAPSRGELVMRMLRETGSPLRSSAALLPDGGRYHGFNLLVGEDSGAAFASNRASGALSLGAGIHGLSNHLLDTPWPKLLRTKARLAAWLADDDPAIETAFALLADREPAADVHLPATGVSAQWESLLSSPFIVSPEYGTRSSTLLLVGRDNSARLVERSFDAGGGSTGEVAFEFRIASAR